MVDEFEFDDDFEDEFADFEEEVDPFSFDDDFDLDIDDAVLDDFEESDLPSLEDEVDTGGGSSNSFLFLAGLLIVLFIVGLGAVVVLALGDGPSDRDLTATAIVQANATTLALASQTAEQALVIAQAQTETALAPTNTLPPTVTPTSTPSPTIDPTDLAGTKLAQQPTEAPETPTPEGGFIESSSVELTATALALLIAPPEGGDAGGGGPPTPTQGFLPTALPDTGLFDNVATGGTAGVTSILLLAAGLVAVIFASRRLRSSLTEQ